MIEMKTLKAVPLFQGLTTEQLKTIAEHGEERSVRRGEVVFEQGAPSDGMYVVLEGRVQITIRMSRQSEQAPVHTVTEGEVFGEFALLGKTERTATARTSADARFFVLSAQDLDTLAETDPVLGYRILRQLTNELAGRLIKTTQALRSSLMF